MQICLLSTIKNPQLLLLCTTPSFPWSSDYGTKLTCEHSGHNSAEATEMVWIWLVTATAPHQVSMNVFYPHHPRVANNWALIPLTHSCLFACLFPNFCCPHWARPGFNNFPISYIQTCHFSSLCSTILSATYPLKRTPKLISLFFFFFL